MLIALKDSLGANVSDESYVSAIDTHLKLGKKFFRGGQAHGILKLTSVCDAFRRLLGEPTEAMSTHLFNWALGDLAHARKFTSCVFAASKCLKAGDYWIKRCLEVVLLSSPHISGLKAVDLDTIMDIWPLGTGTVADIRRIWPGLRRPEDLRAALRVLQRALGSGQKLVPMVLISAFSCCYHRKCTGLLDW